MTPKNAEIYHVASIGKGALYVMPKPSAENLSQDIMQFAEQGITKIVSLLQPDEANSLGLSNMQLACAHRGIEFVSFPVVDRSIPNKIAATSFVHALYESINSGDKVSVHCKGGVGRTGTIACCVLQLAGRSADEAMAEVSVARGRSVPDTEEQKQFVAAFPL